MTGWYAGDIPDPNGRTAVVTIANNGIRFASHANWPVVAHDGSSSAAAREAAEARLEVGGVGDPGGGRLVGT
ncbi:hypothetical protein [Streptomyces sp. NBC_01717]|uniref:hypothetical protein n=1 Tax=Streptomyces sp. NBC_01717 TaxID=2975918 RepID=UPI003FCD5214